MTNTMNTVRTTSWSSIGHDVSSAKNIDEVLNLAGLNYTVETQPLFLPDGAKIFDQVATVDTTNNRYIGHVSPNYTICQNAQAFDFVNEISEDITFVKAGETANGLVYVIGALPDMEILGDTITPHVILQNGHNGRYALKATINPLRIVCQNQFNIAFKENPNSINIIHSSKLESKIIMARKLLASVAQYMAAFEENLTKMYGQKCSREVALSIIEDFFKQAIDDNSTQRKIETAESNILQFRNAYDADDNQNFTGSLLGLANAATDFITHKKSLRADASDENKFQTITFDPRILQNFIDFAAARIAA